MLPLAQNAARKNAVLQFGHVRYSDISVSAVKLSANAKNSDILGDVKVKIDAQ